MEFLDLLSKATPVIVAVIGLIVVLAKIDSRLAVLEEKGKTLFEIINKKGKE